MVAGRWLSRMPSIRRHERGCSISSRWRLFLLSVIFLASVTAASQVAEKPENLRSASSTATAAAVDDWFWECFDDIVQKQFSEKRDPMKAILHMTKKDMRKMLDKFKEYVKDHGHGRMSPTTARRRMKAAMEDFLEQAKADPTSSAFHNQVSKCTVASCSFA